MVIGLGIYTCPRSSVRLCTVCWLFPPLPTFVREYLKVPTVVSGLMHACNFQMENMFDLFHRIAQTSINFPIQTVLLLKQDMWLIFLPRSSLMSSTSFPLRPPPPPLSRGDCLACYLSEAVLFVQCLCMSKKELLIL